MKVTYKVTNEELFKNVVDVDIEVLGSALNVEIELVGGRRIEVWGGIGDRDFEEEYGFILVTDFDKPLI